MVSALYASGLPVFALWQIKINIEPTISITSTRYNGLLNHQLTAENRLQLDLCKKTVQFMYSVRVTMWL